MAFNKVGIYYIHWEQPEFLWPSIAAQADWVDYIFVLDSSLEPREWNLPEHCRHKVEIEHTHKFGSGFENQYGLGHFEQVEARNYATNKVFDKCHVVFQCDTDEYYSPQAYIWARTAGVEALNVLEVVWRTETSYSISPHRHLRAAHRDTGYAHIQNPDKAFIKDGNFHRSRHSIPKCKKGKILNVNNLWHNHLHYLYQNYNAAKFNVIEMEPGNPNVLTNGVFPSSYHGLIENRKENNKYGMRKI